LPLLHPFALSKVGEVCCGYFEVEPLVTKIICSAAFALMLAPSTVLAQNFDMANTAFNNSDFATVLSELTPLAENGDAEAQYTLGIIYSQGQGVLQDDAEAVKWYRRAADQGYVLAQGNLGYMFSKGRGVVQNDGEAMKWFWMAAEQGQGSAQYNVGLRYHKGQGVLQDYVEAKRWYRMAAVQGIAQAQHNLGYMYSTGKGVTQDYVTSHVWFNIASANGHEGAGVNRDELTKQLSPADVSTAQRRARVCLETNYQNCD
jgi:TPR repeat protein